MAEYIISNNFEESNAIPYDGKLYELPKTSVTVSDDKKNIEISNISIGDNILLCVMMYSVDDSTTSSKPKDITTMVSNSSIHGFDKVVTDIRRGFYTDNLHYKYYGYAFIECLGYNGSSTVIYTMTDSTVNIEKAYGIKITGSIDINDAELYTRNYSKDLKNNSDFDNPKYVYNMENYDDPKELNDSTKIWTGFIRRSSITTILSQSSYGLSGAADIIGDSANGKYYDEYFVFNKNYLVLGKEINIKNGDKITIKYADVTLNIPKWSFDFDISDYKGNDITGSVSNFTRPITFGCQYGAYMAAADGNGTDIRYNRFLVSGGYGSDGESFSGGKRTGKDPFAGKIGGSGSQSNGFDGHSSSSASLSPSYGGSQNAGGKCAQSGSFTYGYTNISKNGGFGSGYEGQENPYVYYPGAGWYAGGTLKYVTSDYSTGAGGGSSYLLTDTSYKPAGYMTNYSDIIPKITVNSENNDGTASMHITLTVTDISSSGSSQASRISYFTGNKFDKCSVHYFTGTEFKTCDAYYFTGTEFKKLGG